MKRILFTLVDIFLYLVRARIVSSLSLSLSFRAGLILSRDGEASGAAGKTCRGES
jgi:hypothetical protein